MGQITIRELRNRGGDVIDRVAKGERVTITRSGKPVAELRPFIAAKVSARGLLERWRRLPLIDPARFRADVDRAVESSL